MSDDIGILTAQVTVNLPGKSTKTVPVVLWNGRKDYESKPAIEALGAKGLVFGHVHVIQISDGIRDSVTERVQRLAYNGADSVVIWARDTGAYNAIVDEVDARIRPRN